MEGDCSRSLSRDIPSGSFSCCPVIIKLISIPGPDRRDLDFVRLYICIRPCKGKKVFGHL